MSSKFFTCTHCGNLALLLRDKGVPLYCCSEPMKRLNAGESGASAEKHAPIYECSEHSVRVRVGQTPHPMEPEHYIEWIALETRLGFQLAHLTPSAAPEAVFPLAEGDAVKAVYAFCNQHDLWRNE